MKYVSEERQQCQKISVSYILSISYRMSWYVFLCFPSFYLNKNNINMWVFVCVNNEKNLISLNYYDNPFQISFLSYIRVPFSYFMFLRVSYYFLVANMGSK